MALLSMAIQKRGGDAISFTGSQSGIVTNDRHFDAKIIEVRPHRVEDELARGRIVIVAGYQGMSYRREITTLGRGGSDTTALAMAAALGATRAEIYSDVDGVYSADPRTVPNARHLPELSYDEMQEMSDVGAKVLHAKAVEFAKRSGIAIHARAAFAPGRETVVQRETAPSAGARAVVGQRGLVRVHATEERAFERAEALATERGAALREVGRRDGGGGEMVVVLDHTPDWAATRAQLEAELRDALAFEEGLGAVSVVGEGFGGNDESVARALGVLGRSGIEPRRVARSARRLTALVAEEALDRAVRDLHGTLVPGAEPTG
jgi:aspartate kinase